MCKLSKSPGWCRGALCDGLTHCVGGDEEVPPTHWQVLACPDLAGTTAPPGLFRYLTHYCYTRIKFYPIFLTAIISISCHLNFYKSLEVHFRRWIWRWIQRWFPRSSRIHLWIDLRSAISEIISDIISEIIRRWSPNNDLWNCTSGMNSEMISKIIPEIALPRFHRIWQAIICVYFDNVF